MKMRPEIRSVTTGSFILTTAFLVTVTIGSSCAVAQVAGFYESDNPYVTVDMSVLEAGNSTAAARSFPSGYTGTLDVPGQSAPISRLHVKPRTGTGSLPAPEKGIAMTSPAPGMEMPPVTPPKSMIEVPSKDIPEPSARRPDGVSPAPTTVAKPSPQALAKTAEAPPAPAVAAPEPLPQPPTAAQGMAAAPADMKEQAALPLAGMAAAPGKAAQVVFGASTSKLPDGTQDELKSLVASILEKPNLRLQLLAYAGGESLSSSKARRLSLSRALSVRSSLIENGLRSTRIDVRALGNKTTEEPVNRVDINIIER